MLFSRYAFLAVVASLLAKTDAAPATDVDARIHKLESVLHNVDEVAKPESAPAEPRNVSADMVRAQATRLTALEANISALSHDVTAQWSSGECCGGPVDDDIFVRFKLNGWNGPRDHFRGPCNICPQSLRPCSDYIFGERRCSPGQICNYGGGRNDCAYVPSMPDFPSPSDSGGKLLSRTPMLYTHDAGTGWMNFQGDYRSPWMATQEVNPFHQLECGARMLDVRIEFDDTKTNRYHHGGEKVGQSLETDMEGYVRFAQAHPNDLIVLYISHCVNRGNPSSCEADVHTKVLKDNNLLMLDSGNSNGWQGMNGTELLKLSKSKSGHGLVTPWSRPNHAQIHPDDAVLTPRRHALIMS